MTCILIETTMLSVWLFIVYCKLWIIERLNDFSSVTTLICLVILVRWYIICILTSDDSASTHISRLPHVKHAAWHSIWWNYQITPPTSWLLPTFPFHQQGVLDFFDQMYISNRLPPAALSPPLAAGHVSYHPWLALLPTAVSFTRNSFGKW